MNGMWINKAAFIIPEIPAIAIYDLTGWTDHYNFLKTLRYTLFKIDKTTNKATSINNKKYQIKVLKQLLKKYQINTKRFGSNWIDLSS